MNNIERTLLGIGKCNYRHTQCQHIQNEIIRYNSKGIGFSNEDYIKAGAQIVNSAEHVFDSAELIVKVKEPLKSEIALLKSHHVLFTYLHLAADIEQTEGLIHSGCIAIAYETVTDADGKLPLLAPMSEIAGRMSVQVGAQCLEKANGGKGVLIGGATGVSPANVVILGGGVAGTNAAQMAVGLGGSVTIFDKSRDRLKDLDLLFDENIETVLHLLHVQDYPILIENHIHNTLFELILY